MTRLPTPLILAARSVRSTHLAVLVELYSSLDDQSYRKPPIPEIVNRLRLAQSVVYDAIRQLADDGYLEQGPRLGNALTFRLANPSQRAVA